MMINSTYLLWWNGHGFKGKRRTTCGACTHGGGAAVVDIYTLYILMNMYSVLVHRIT
jgi:hypothetical protein